MCKLFRCESPLRTGIFALIACATLLSFHIPGPLEASPRQPGHDYYDLDNPEAKYMMPDYLEEISGMSYYGKGKIASIQDEKAFICVWDLAKEEITNKYKFGYDADYEDIDVIGKASYILRNNGHIYRAIYKFDLEEKELETKPYFLIDLKRLDSYTDQNAFKKISVSVAKRLQLIDG